MTAEHGYIQGNFEPKPGIANGLRTCIYYA
jgi:hypothetical protein